MFDLFLTDSASEIDPALGGVSGSEGFTRVVLETAEISGPKTLS